jgi:hypothetical protein
MDKWELIEITLDQLMEQWLENKDLFQTDTISNYTNVYRQPQIDTYYVVWSPPKNEDGSHIDKSVYVSYNHVTKIFQCGMFSGEISNGKISDSTVRATKILIPIRRLYRRFMRLRKNIDNHHKTKFGNKYLEELCSVFPGTLDDDLLGKKG